MQQPRLLKPHNYIFLKHCFYMKYFQLAFLILTKKYMDDFTMVTANFSKWVKKFITRRGGGRLNIGVYKSADPPKFETKSAIRLQWSCLNLNPLKALLTMNSHIQDPN
jgi:hypothetical protein